tara:strand:- start:1500 stop:2798 length:1299 start_codon:yes stop_codon:yes gene_type:complete
MLIYTPKITSRIQYSFELIFDSILNIDYDLSEDIVFFQNFSGPKLNYSKKQLENEFFIKAYGLLSERGISDQEIIFDKWNELPIFFKIKDSVLPFDIFSASFYLVSRYEEYLPHIKDKYERFDAKESLAFKNNFLHRPLINLWVSELKNIFKMKLPSLKFPQNKFSYQSTIDVDNAYYFLEKGFVRTVASFIKSAFNLDKVAIKERKNTLLGKLSDPYDTFQDQMSINEKYNVDVVYFFLLANYGTNDKNCSVNSRKFQLLIKHLADHAKIGIHPSYASNKSFDILTLEKNRLENILKKEVTLSRQHFLKLEIPNTYRNLLELSITDDYTMGYASHLGFRASICTPFYFYDIEVESSTNLKVHPFSVMDATLKYYLNLHPNEALANIQTIIDEIKNVNGHFISVWHNETWSDYKEWSGWSYLYEQMLEYINK